MWTYETTRATSVAASSSYSSVVTETGTGTGSTIQGYVIGSTFVSQTNTSHTAVGAGTTNAQTSAWLSATPSFTFLDSANTAVTVTAQAFGAANVTQAFTTTQTGSQSQSLNDTSGARSTSGSVSAGATSIQGATYGPSGGTTTASTVNLSTSVSASTGASTTTISNQTFTGSTIQSFSFVGPYVYNYVSLATGYTSSSVIIGAGTTITTSSTTQSGSFPYLSGAFIMSTTSATTTATANVTTSTTSASSSLQPNSTTISYSYTTTGTPTSSTSSSLTSTLASTGYTATISTTATSTSTAKTYSTASGAFPCIIDTIYQAESSDWLWTISTTGTNTPSSIGASFTKTTISGSITSLSLNTDAVGPLGGAATITYTEPYALGLTVGTLVSFTSSTSTYAVGAMPTTTTVHNGTTSTTTVAAALPLTSTSVATQSFTTATTASYTYVSFSTYTASQTCGAESNYGSTLESDGTIIGSSPVGAAVTSLTFTIPVGSVFTTGSTTGAFGAGGSASGTSSSVVGTSTLTWSTSSNGTGAVTSSSAVSASLATTGSAATIVTQTGSSATFTSYTFVPVFTYVTISAFTQTMVSWVDATISPGWQATPTALGSSKPIGTNIGGPASITMQAQGWPGVSVDAVSSTSTATIAGSQTTTQNSYESSVMGGFSWSTGSTTLQDTAGGFVVTTCDSFSNTGTTTTIFSPAASTITIASGHGIALAPMPLCWSTTASSNSNPFIDFPAFPVGL